MFTDLEAIDQQKKSEPQPTIMPDYAAGLLNPTLDVSSFIVWFDFCNLTWLNVFF